MQAIADGQQPIALCECAMLPIVLLVEAEALRFRDILWFVDNTAALGAVVRGVSSNPMLEKLVALHWSVCFRFRCRVRVEYIDSKSNWADGISRTFQADEFAARHSFSIRELGFDPSWLSLSYKETWVRSRSFDLPSS